MIQLSPQILLMILAAAVTANASVLFAADSPAVASKSPSIKSMSAKPAVAEKPAPKPELTEAQIAKLVKELGARNYTVREEATKQLLEAGQPAVKPLVEAAEKEDLEVSLRALRILESLFTKGSHSEYLAAESALERLQQSKEGSLASRAGTILASMGDVREKRAIAAIRELNGILKSDPNQLAFLPNNLPVGEEWITTVILKKSWKGQVEGLKHLENLRFLRTVYVVEGTVPAEAIAELERKMPQTHVEMRGGACLGVGGGFAPGGCEISIVNPGSAAAKAGLRPGDLILAFNGKRGAKEGEPLDFDRLVQLIKEVDAGDKVPILIRRNGDEQTVNVIMDEWK